MYSREKPLRHDFHKPRKNHDNTPSFSSTLLDEIYRSIDGNAEKNSKSQGSYRAKTFDDDEGVASFARACLVDKWMEKDNDLMFFSSTSSSSDSSGALSSSDTEFFASTTKPPKVSCFSTRPKPVRTGVKSKHEESLLSAEVDLIKSKSRALKIYANLKKVKQPISPGGRLTSFINSLFTNGNAKKSKNVDSNNKVLQDLKSPKTKAPSTCSSASSFSRSCLSKYSPKSTEKMRSGDQRTVRFHPVGVIVDEDSRPCGHKTICDEDSRRPPLPTNSLTEIKMSKMEKNRIVGFKGYDNKRADEFSVHKKIHDRVEDEEEDDCLSDSSSDLFELDHLALFGDDRFCEELPVYETTHFDTNRAITSRLIR